MNVISDIKRLKSDVSLVIDVENEFNRDLWAYQKNLDRMYLAWDAYFALDGGGWERSILAELREQNRIARSYDVISPKVDTLTGSIISELPDLAWEPVEGQKTTATEAIEHTYYTDKSLSNGEFELMQVIRDGLIHCGWAQLVELPSDKFGKPVIAFKRITPGSFIPSRYWLDGNDKNLKCGHRVGYYTPNQLKNLYKGKYPEIEAAIRQMKTNGGETMPLNHTDMRRQYVGRVADMYKVIEKHYIKEVQTSRLIGAKYEINTITGEKTGNVSWVPFPVTDDRKQLEKFAAINQIDWTTVDEVPYKDIIHKVITVCPDLDRSIILENGNSKIQTRGLPFFHFCVSEKDGQQRGVVGTMLDVQYTINERESLVSELINSANGGADVVDENLFNTPKEKENFRLNKNKPGETIFADFRKAKSTNPIYKVGGAQYPSQVLDQIQRMYEVALPLISRVSDSMSSITESGKSGVLFDKELHTNRIANLIMNYGIKNMMNNFGDAYFYQWQVTYRGIRREVTSRNGKEKTVLNEEIYKNGQRFIRNAVEYVPRCRALVTESQKSSTYQMKYRMIYSDLLSSVNPEANPEHYNFLFTSLLQTLDLPEKDRGRLEELKRHIEIKDQMNFVRQIVDLHAATKNSALQAVNADFQLQQLAMQMQQMGMQGAEQPVVPEQLTDAVQEADDIPDENNNLQYQQEGIE